MASDLTAKIKITGDANQLVSELDRTETDLKDLGRTAQSIRILENAVADVSRLEGELQGAQAKVRALQTTISEAMSLDVDAPALRKLNADLAAAEKAADKAEAALAKSKTTVVGLNLEFGKTGVSTSNLAQKKELLAAETSKVSAKVDELTGKLTAATTAEGHLAAGANSVNAAFATLNIRSADQIQAEINSINKALVVLASNAKVSGGDFDRAYASAQTRLTALRAELNAAEGASAKTGTAIVGMGSQLAALAAPLAGIGIGKAFVDANVSAESLERTLTQLTGSGEAAAQEIEYLRAASERMGLDVQDASRAYISLMASAKGTAMEGQATRDIFEAVAGAMSKLGKSSADTEGALQAVAQMMSKGVVSMEEMRQQLGERLPNAMQSTAKELGITVEELGSMIESGQMLASDVLPAMARGLEKTYGTAGQAEGSIAAWNRLKNAINDTFVFVGNSGVWSGLVSVLSVAAAAVSGLAAAFELLGKIIGITFGAIVSFDFAHPIDSFNNWRKAVSDAGNDIQAKLDKVKKSAEEAGPAQVKLAEQGKQAADAAKEQGASWTAVGVAYGKVAKAAEEASTQAVKSAAARAEENKAAVALAQAFGTEIEKRTASAKAAKSDAAALEAVAEARRIEAAVAQSNVIALQKAAEAEGKLSDEKIKAIQKAQENANAKQTEAEKTAAAALAAEQHAAALEVEGQALADNSGRVTELRAAHEAAAAALEQTRLAHERGAATLAQVQQAEIAAGQAATLYRDALQDLAVSIDAKSRVEQANMDVTAAGIKLQIAQVDSQYQVAKAYGDEAAAAVYLMQKKQLEIDLAELTAKAKRAEAEAALLSVKARRDEAEATGTLTVAKEAEFKAQEAAAQVKVIEAQIAEETAVRMRDLAAATDESAASSGRAKDGFGGLADQLRDVSGAADDAAASIDKVTASNATRTAAASSSGTLANAQAAGIDFKSLALGRGATTANVDAIAEAANAELTKMLAARTAAGATSNDQTLKTLISLAVDTAIAANRKATATSSSTSPAASQTVRVDLRTNAGVNTVNVQSTTDMNALLATLSELQLRGI